MHMPLADERSLVAGLLFEQAREDGLLAVPFCAVVGDAVEVAVFSC